jgi:hypothetical protein
MTQNITCACGKSPSYCFIPKQEDPVKLVCANCSFDYQFNYDGHLRGIEGVTPSYSYSLVPMRDSLFLETQRNLILGHYRDRLSLMVKSVGNDTVTPVSKADAMFAHTLGWGGLSDCFLDCKTVDNVVTRHKELLKELQEMEAKK